MAVARKFRPALDFAAFEAMIAPLPDDERWELIGGQAIMMAPPVARHQRIVGNFYAALRQMVRGRQCEAYPGLGVASDHAEDFATIPDVVVHCGPPVEGGYTRTPLIVVEVLSPSTMPTDRGPKLVFYQGIESLNLILHVYPDEARIEYWPRAGTSWGYEVASGMEAVVPMPSLDGRLELTEVYEGVSFAPARRANS